MDESLQKKVKKPVYKRGWFWVLIIFICISAIGLSSTSSSSENAGSVIQNDSLEKAKLSPQKVRNDTTGNWRISTTSTPIKIDKKNVLAYYKNYFKSDDEVHAIVSFGLKTTTKIWKTPIGLNVTIYEYVNGEEHDAKKLFSGSVLSDKFYNSETGEEIELNQEQEKQEDVL